ncbi:MAG TPA: hypothetical protein ENI07_02370 [Desulfobacterales bacterium]|nr:hypothetical protein [Desulfobacterales bacterium]
MRKYFISGLLLIWLLVTLIAIAGMYRLWWQRERTLYWGQDITTQRSKVLQRAGIPVSTLKDFKKIDSKWPINIHYKPSGNHNTLSYLTYLLIPRIPSGESEYRLKVERAKVDFSGNPSPVPTKHPYTDGPKVQGLILSILLVSGFAYILKFVRPSLKMSVPELSGLACFLLMTAVLLSIRVFNSAGFGFKLYAAVGGIGWVLFSYEHIKKLSLSSAGKWSETRSYFFKKIFPDNKSQTKEGRRLFMTLLYLIGLLIFVWSLLMAVIVVPDDWDAWAIWGAKAKVLALAQGPLENVIYFGHQDYPLLWPAVWAFSGWCSGGWEEHWSRGWGVLFMLLTAWQISTIIHRQTRHTKTALTGAILFLSIPMVPLVASWSYAEAPLWLMITCCFGCLLRWRTDESKINLFLGALFAAAAAYTKNEGVLFALLGFLWVLATKSTRWRDAIFIYLIPFAILYAPWVYWTRISLDMSSHATVGLVFNTDAVMIALKRVPETMRLIGNMWLDIKQWNVVLGLIGLAMIFHLVKGKKHQWIDIMLPVSLLLGFLVIILFHSQNIGWQVGTSWNRLTIQAIPLFIIAIVINPSGFLKLSDGK